MILKGEDKKADQLAQPDPRDGTVGISLVFLLPHIFQTGEADNPEIPVRTAKKKSPHKVCFV